MCDGLCSQLSKDTWVTFRRTCSLHMPRSLNQPCPDESCDYRVKKKRYALGMYWKLQKCHFFCLLVVSLCIKFGYLYSYSHGILLNPTSFFFRSSCCQRHDILVFLDVSIQIGEWSSADAFIGCIRALSRRTQYGLPFWPNLMNLQVLFL